MPFNESFEYEKGKRPMPEQVLLLGILKRSIMDYLNTSANIEIKKNAETLRELERWFSSNDRSCKNYFSFLDVCEHLDLDAEGVRKAVQGLKDDKCSVSRFRSSKLYTQTQLKKHG